MNVSKRKVVVVVFLLGIIALAAFTGLWFLYRHRVIPDVIVQLSVFGVIVIDLSLFILGFIFHKRESWLAFAFAGILLLCFSLILYYVVGIAHPPKGMAASLNLLTAQMILFQRYRI